MEDAISKVVNKYDIVGKYLDFEAINEINTYFTSGLGRIQISILINSSASAIVKEASAQLYEEQP